MMANLLLFSSVFLGTIFGYFFRDNKKFSKLILVISAGYLLAICVLELFPSVYVNYNNTNISIWILVGVFIQLILESFTKGVEHGHIHLHHNTKIPYGLLIGLCIHAFIEGIPTNTNYHNHSHLLWAICIHNVPISFILSAQLFSSSLKPIKTIALLFLFALMSPLGNIFGIYFSENYFHIFTAIVSGIFLHISSVIIFESNESHTFNIKKLIYVLLGVFIAYSTSIIHLH